MCKGGEAGVISRRFAALHPDRIERRPHRRYHPFTTRSTHNQYSRLLCYLRLLALKNVRKLMPAGKRMRMQTAGLSSQGLNREFQAIFIDVYATFRCHVVAILLLIFSFALPDPAAAQSRNAASSAAHTNRDVKYARDKQHDRAIAEFTHAENASRRSVICPS